MLSNRADITHRLYIPVNLKHLGLISSAGKVDVQLPWDKECVCGVCVCPHAHLWASVSLYVCLCMCDCVSLSVCVSVSMSLYICLGVYGLLSVSSYSLIIAGSYTKYKFS